MSSWIEQNIPEDSDFTLQNLPFGVYRNAATQGTICVAIADKIMDLRVWSASMQNCTEQTWNAEVVDALQQVRRRADVL